MDKNTYLAIGAFGMHNFVLFCSFLISIRALASHFIGFLTFLFFPKTKSGLPSLFDLQAVTCQGGGCTLSGIFKFTIFSILWIYLNSSVHFKKTENRKTNFKSTDLILFRRNLWGTLWCRFRWCSLFWTGAAWSRWAFGAARSASCHCSILSVLTDPSSTKNCRSTLLPSTPPRSLFRFHHFFSNFANFKNG